MVLKLPSENLNIHNSEDTESMTKTADLKGSNFTLSVLHLPNDDITQALSMLEQKVAQAPSFLLPLQWSLILKMYRMKLILLNLN